jgi:hypothetical protein
MQWYSVLVSSSERKKTEAPASGTSQCRDLHGRVERPGATNLTGRRLCLGPGSAASLLPGAAANCAKHPSRQLLQSPRHLLVHFVFGTSETCEAKKTSGAFLLFDEQGQIQAISSGKHNLKILNVSTPYLRTAKAQTSTTYEHLYLYLYLYLYEYSQGKEPKLRTNLVHSSFTASQVVASTQAHWHLPQPHISFGSSTRECGGTGMRYIQLPSALQHQQTILILASPVS